MTFDVSYVIVKTNRLDLEVKWDNLDEILLPFVYVLFKMLLGAELLVFIK